MTTYILDHGQAHELQQRLEAWLNSGPTAQERFDVATTLKSIVAPPPRLGPDDWVFSQARAAIYTQTHEQLLDSERKPKLPPHHLRCEFVNGHGVRCRKGEHHERVPNDTGHEAPK